MPPKPQQPNLAALGQILSGFFDAEWYRSRYPEVDASGADAMTHFLTWGAAEGRDPNRWFDSRWYVEHYPDLAASGMPPLLHYMVAGAAELRNPHPRFDAAWYADQHPEAAANPLLHHLLFGEARGWPTEPAIDITDYLPATARPLTTPKQVRVDVVVPVYRGLEETRRCLDSVLADPDRPPGQVIVVDDRSPEPALSAWLDTLAASGRITLLRNRRNLGFVASTNRGIEAAGTHDVVLLNSDTEVPPGWLRRLAAQAYAAPDIASVSPFSNNATICGYPNNAGGPLALGLDLATIDDVCRRVNAGRSVEVPTTVGFCMYIRRAALDQVGAFDAEAFGRGYGEENDFCMRAAQRGWTHRLACDTFVYHEGSVSFGASKDQRVAEAQEELARRHPDYARIVARHVQVNAVASYRFAVTAALFRHMALPVVLMLSHELGGGVQRQLDELVASLARRANVLLLQATVRGTALSAPALRSGPLLTLPADRLEDFVAVLRSAAVSRVHVHHLMGVDLDVRALIHRLGVKFDVTLHDWFAICPQVNLLPWPEGYYCGEPGPAGCNACIAERPSHGAKDILSWRRRLGWLFLEADRVICPSEDARARLQRHGLADRAIVAPHQPVPAGAWDVAAPVLMGRKLRVALLGVLADQKGAQTVFALAEAADQAAIELHLIGYPEDSLPETVQHRIAVTGEYADAGLPGLLAKVKPHVVWFPAQWPETYSYTLSAAIEAGLPVVAARIGSFVERLQGRPLSWLVDPRASTEEWLHSFEEVRQALAGAGSKVERPSAAPGQAKVAPVKPGAAKRLSAKGMTAEVAAAQGVPAQGVPAQGVPPKRVPVRALPARITSSRIARSNAAGSRTLPSKVALSADVPQTRPQVADFYPDQYLAPFAAAQVCAGKRGATEAEHLVDLRRPGRTSIVVVAELMDNAQYSPCAYIRLLQPLDHLAIGGGFDIVLADAAEALCYRADIIATQRYAVPDIASADALAAHCRRTGATLAYDLDDDLLHIPRDHPDAPALRPKAKVVQRLLHSANAVIVSTPALAASLAPPRRASLAPQRRDALVVPNGLDERLWSDLPAGALPGRRVRGGPVRILCMGTATHGADFALIEPALARLNDMFGDRVTIDVLGVTTRSDLPEWANRVGMPPNATATYPGFVNWITQQEGWDIGLAPLADTPFNRCKSAIKTLDYAALGLAVVASDVPAYRGSLADGTGGLLAANRPEAWYAALSKLVRDGELRWGLARGAVAALAAEGTLARQAEERRKAWLSLTP
jgi:GT2 family glycosyltransferase/glycosyltransferase involved in cell wall biosynthesis